MKKTFKYLIFAALIAVTVFSFVIFGCKEPDKNGDEQNDPNVVVLKDIASNDIGSSAYSQKQPFNDITASELVAGIKLGWNLGNTLDAGASSSTPIADMETAWVKHKTNNENIRTLRRAGFNTIRIPVSWAKTTSKANNFKIPDVWMARVTEIANYAVAYDMYVIINTHHDEGIFGFKDTNVQDGINAFSIIWGQIADNFKNYNEKLIFEALNEPRTKGSSAEWSGGTKEERDNINKYYAAFVEVVRKSGGNNNNRFLLLNPYAASAENAAMTGLVLPEDTANKKLIVSYHHYAPYNFALNTNKTYNTWDKDKPSDIADIYNGVIRANSNFISKGIPVIIGEFGAMNKNNEETRAAWAEFYVGHARENGIPMVWWDNAIFEGNGELFGLLDRTTNKFPYPLVVNALLKGAGLQ